MNEMTAAPASMPARSLMEIEVEIRHQKNVIGEGYVKIGLALIEAKKQLQHGEWADWLRDRVNFSQSSADGYMRVAREYGSGSQLLNLPYTKVLALLAVPAEEREDFATDNHVEDKSVSEIKRLIRERDEAKQWGREQMERADKLYKRAETAEAQIKAERRDQVRLTVMLNREREHVAQLMAREPDTVTVEKEVPPSDYERLKNQIDDYKEMIEEADDELAQARVERDQAIKALEQAQERDPMDVKPFCDACSLFLNSVFMAPFSKEKLEEKTDAELDRISMSVHNVLEWAVNTQDAVDSIRDARSGFEKAFVLNL